jgi:hypothetical protein
VLLSPSFSLTSVGIVAPRGETSPCPEVVSLDFLGIKPTVSVCSGGHNKILQTSWLKQQRFPFSKFGVERWGATGP